MSHQIAKIGNLLDKIFLWESFCLATIHMYVLHIIRSSINRVSMQEIVFEMLDTVLQFILKSRHTHFCSWTTSIVIYVYGCWKLNKILDPVHCGLWGLFASTYFFVGLIKISENAPLRYDYNIPSKMIKNRLLIFNHFRFIWIKMSEHCR